MTCKTYLVPMFLIVRADLADHADAIAAEVQSQAFSKGYMVYLDEGIPTMEVTDEEEYHSILDHILVKHGEAI